MQKVSKEFYLYSIAGGMGGGAVLNLIASLAGSMALMQLAGLASLYGGIVGLVLLYKMWTVIQPASTTPGAAVGFLFIPIFNFYWIFRAFWFWTKDYNALRAKRNLSTAPSNEQLALVMCILALASFALYFAVHIVALLCGLAVTGLIILFYMNGIEVVNGLAEPTADFTAPPPTAPPAPPQAQ